jgi:cephalosporin hydroxylase
MESAAEPLFTVVMPVHDHARFLGQAIESVIAQTYGDWELVVVDDGSTDGSGEIAEGHASRDRRIRVLRQDRTGPGGARNRAIAEARGRWIAYLDSDDLWFPETLGAYASAIAAHPVARFFHGFRHRLSLDGSVVESRGIHQEGPTGPAELFARCHLATLCVCHERALFAETGGFDASIGNGEDYDLFLRMSLRAPLWPLGRATGLRRRHDRNLSRPCGGTRLAEAKVLERFAAQASSTIDPGAAARRVARSYRAAGRAYLREGKLPEALGALRAAARHRRSPSVIALRIYAKILLASRILRRTVRLVADLGIGGRLAGEALLLRASCPPRASLEEAVDRVLACRPFRPIQKRSEILGLLRLLQGLPVHRICEIGARRGGTLFLFARASEPGARILSIDIDFPARRRAACRTLVDPSRHGACIRADSHDPRTVERVRRWLGGELLDALFIDGDHSRAGAEADCKLFAPLVRDGGLIAFHDIVPGTGPSSYTGGVPDLWASLKAEAREAMEIVEDPGQDGCGIGVLVRRGPLPAGGHQPVAGPAR